MNVQIWHKIIIVIHLIYETKQYTLIAHDLHDSGEHVILLHVYVTGQN